MSNNNSDTIGRPSSLEEQVDTTNTSRERLGSGGSGNFDDEWDAAAEEGTWVIATACYFFCSRGIKLTFTTHYKYPSAARARDGMCEEDVGDSNGNCESNTSDDYEEECVICLEELSSKPWGRCTPCNHPFHKQCWWEWENAHNERIDRQRRRQGDNSIRNEGVKCCLCNTINKQFVDNNNNTPAHNPSPYVASSDAADTVRGGNRFTNWFRGVGEEAGEFLDFLQSELRQPAFGRSGNGNNRSNNTNGQSGRRGFVPPLFGQWSRSNSSRGNSNSANGSSTFVPPFFRNRNSNHTGSQQTWATSNTDNTTSNGNPFNRLRPGTQIVTQHLVNAPHLNHQRGAILRYQPQSSRYLVQLQSDIGSFISGEAAPVAIKPENLLQTVKVKIHGLRSQQSLNGKEGTVIGYSRERNRYVVKVDYLFSDSREISLKPINIRIPNGTIVRLEGLEQASQWNGKYGTIIKWVGDANGSVAGRYEVCLSRQYGVRVKLENVRL